MAHPRLQAAATLCSRRLPRRNLPLGVNLGTAMWCRWLSTATVSRWRYASTGRSSVRDGIVWDFFGAVTIVRRHLDTLEQQFGAAVFSHAATSFPLWYGPAYFINVLESAGRKLSHVLDRQPQLRICATGQRRCSGYRQRHCAGIAIVKKGKVAYSADEATGGHHISDSRRNAPYFAGRGRAVQTRSR